MRQKNARCFLQTCIFIFTKKNRLTTVIFGESLQVCDFFVVYIAFRCFRAAAQSSESDKSIILVIVIAFLSSF